MKKFLLYLLKWEMSTPIIAIVMLMPIENIIVKTIIANFIGAIIFYKVDMYIFRNKK